MSIDFLWVEKYRPRTVEETILPKRLKDVMQNIVKGGEVPNMIFSGTSGIGKTTIARAICNELGLDYILINGSEEGNIDTLRGKIKQFASSVSLQGGYKVVILDEADYLNAQSTQPALRAFIEEFSDNCRFILTCNFKHKIIEPLHSRCTLFEFNPKKPELAELCGLFLTRLESILNAEGIEYDRGTLADIIKRYLPDWRKILGVVQSNALTGNVKGQALIEETDFDELFKKLKEGDFKGIRQWVANHIDLDSVTIFRGIYDRMNGKVKPESIPHLVLILADYQYKAAFVADRELNTVACMVELMGAVKFS
jgi:DNA polymerase III delta prime subunit